jgi:hypothetical protein
LTKKPLHFYTSEAKSPHAWPRDSVTAIDGVILVITFERKEMNVA